MEASDLEFRLERLDEHIQTAQDRLKLKGLLSADHQVKTGELRARYAAVRAKLSSETADAEVHGHHVSDLEASVRQWLDSLEIELD